MKKYLVFLMSMVMIFAISSPVSAAPVGLSIEANQQTAIKGEAVELKIDLSNGSDDSEDNISLLVLAETLAGDSSWEIGRINQVQLSRNQTQTFSCVTSFTETGVYKITAQLQRNYGQYIAIESYTSVIVTERASGMGSYTVKFDYNGGNGNTASKRITSGNAYGALPEPTRAGYVFAGWSTDGTLKGMVREDNVVNIVGDHTLTALWAVDISSEYHIIYNGNGATYGSSPIDTADYDAGSVGYILSQGNLSREGHVFTGWNTRADGKGTTHRSGERITVRENVVLYAQWRADGSTVKFDYRGGYGSTGSKTVVLGDTYGSLPQPTRSGYSFSGWSTDGTVWGVVWENTTVSISGDHTLTALWTTESYSYNTYRITYYGNGATYGSTPVDTTNYSSGSSGYISGQGNLSRDGYAFSGWNTRANGRGTSYRAGEWITVRENISLYAQWAAETYTVWFDYQGGTSSMESKRVTFDSTYGSMPTPKRTGYTFAGWSSNGAQSGVVKSNTTVSIAGNHTLTALWTADPKVTYSITYYGNGATSGTAPVDTANYASDSSGYVFGQGKLSREGYTFNGWNTRADGRGTAYTAGEWIAVRENIALYAQWTAETYTVWFDYQGGGGSTESKRVTFDSAYGSLPTPTREEYTFAGWSSDGTQRGVVRTETTVNIAGNHTLTALWTANPKVTYRITYDGNGATSGTVPVDTKSYTAGATGQVSGQGDLVRRRYTFAEWNTKADGSGTAYKAGDRITVKGNLNLYAQWTAVHVYRVQFDYQGGEGSPASKNVTLGSAYGSLPTPTREGYIFGGWSTNGTQRGIVRAETIVSIADDHTLTAIWTAKPSVTYSITYYSNGATTGTAPVSAENYAAGSVATVSRQGDLSRRGYSFAGWNTKADGSGTAYKAGERITINANISLYAQWATVSSRSHHDDDIKVTGVSHSNGQADINFAIRSANGKGYKVYTSESEDGPWQAANVNFNSKGAHVKGLTNGKTYYAYVEYLSDDTSEISEVVQLKPRR